MTRTECETAGCVFCTPNHNVLNQSVNHWCSWDEHPKEESEIDVMWSDNTVDRLQYTLKGYNDLDFSITPTPIKWRYVCHQKNLMR